MGYEWGMEVRCGVGYVAENAGVRCRAWQGIPRRMMKHVKDCAK